MTLPSSCLEQGLDAVRAFVRHGREVRLAVDEFLVLGADREMGFVFHAPREHGRQVVERQALPGHAIRHSRSSFRLVPTVVTRFVARRSARRKCQVGEHERALQGLAACFY
jgi:hypothetical protein